MTDLPVNTFVSGDQSLPVVAVRGDGGYVVVWQSGGQDGVGEGIYAQRFTAQGAAVGGEIGVATGPWLSLPAVAMDAAGDFVVTWQSDARDGYSNGVYARRFAADGTPHGGQVRVNGTQLGAHQESAVAMGADGGFVVAWHSDNGPEPGLDIFLRRYDATGAAQGAEVVVNTTLPPDQRGAAVAMDAAGNVVVVWQSEGEDGSGSGIFGRRYTASGTGIGLDFPVNTITAGNQQNAAVAMAANGDFVVTWESDGADGSEPGVFARRFDATGFARGGEFRINTTTEGSPRNPAIAMEADGRFAIAWQSAGQDGSGDGIYTRRYDAAGVAQGGEVRLNAVTAGNQQAASLALAADGTLIAAWQSEGQDGSGLGVFATQRTATGGGLPVVVLDLDTDAPGTGVETVLAPPLASSSAVLGDAIRIGTVGVPFLESASITLPGDGGGNGSQYLYLTDEAAALAFAARIAAGSNVSGNGYSRIDIIGRADIGVYEAILEGVRYFTDVPAPTPSRRTVTVEVGAGNGPGATATASFEISAAAVPTDVTFDLDTTTPGADAAATVLAGTFPARLFGDTVELTTQGDAAIRSITVSLLQPPDKTAEALLLTEAAYRAAGNAGVSVSSTALIGTISPLEGGFGGQRIGFSGPVGADVFAGLLGELRYANLDATPTLTPRTVQVELEADGIPGVITANLTLNLTRGLDLPVNTVTQGPQDDPAIGMNADGAFLVAWTALGADGVPAVFAQRYDAAASPTGDAFRVSPATGAAATDPAVAIEADGTALVVWQSDAGDGSGRGIFARRYGPDGVAEGDAVLVNLTTAGDQSNPAVAVGGNGATLVAWQSDGQDGSGSGIYAQLLAADGTPLFDEFRASTTTAGDQSDPAVAMDADGGFVVVWQSDGQDGSGLGIYAQRYDAAGLAQGGEFRVSTTTEGRQSNPAVAMDAEGYIVFAWEQAAPGSTVTSIRMQRFTADGVPEGAETAVTPADNISHTGPAVAMDAAGDFVVNWQSAGQDGSGLGVYAQRFDGSGRTVGDTFRVNTVTAGDQQGSAVAMDAQGNFTVTWQSDGQDGSAEGIFLRALTAGVAETPAVVVDLDTAAVGTGSATARYSIGQAPTKVFGADIGIAALYTGLIDGATVRLATRPDGSAEQLLLSDNALLLAQSVGIAVVWDDAAGELRFSGAALPEQYAAALETVAYRNTAAVASTDPRMVAVQVSSGGEVSPAALGTVAVTRGEDLRANDATEGNQVLPAVALDAAGRAVVAWISSTDGEAISLRRYDAAGLPLGAEFRVTAPEAGALSGPVVAGRADGAFVLAWVSDEADGTGPGIRAQRFDAAGVAQGPALRADDGTAGTRADLAIAMDADGGFVLSWTALESGRTTTDILARRYDAAGAALGDAVLVNTDTAFAHDAPAVTTMADGGFVVAWQSDGQDGSGFGIFARRYDAAGEPIGDEIRVNTTTAGRQQNPALAAAPDGGFVIAWQSDGQDGSGLGIYAQRYDAAGEPLGDEVRVNAFTPLDQLNPAVAMDADGGFLVTWQSTAQDGSGAGIFAQRFGADGTAQGDEFRVNAITAGAQTNPVVALAPDGGAIIAWQSDGLDGSGSGIAFQRFQPDGAGRMLLDLDGSAEGTGFATPFITGTPVAIADSDAVVMLGGTARTITLTARLLDRYDALNESLFLEAGPVPLLMPVWDREAGTLTLSGLASPAEAQAALTALRYINDSPLPSGTGRLVELHVTDGETVSNTAVATLGTPERGTGPEAVDNYYEMPRGEIVVSGNVRANDLSLGFPVSSLRVDPQLVTGNYGTLYIDVEGNLSYTQDGRAAELPYSMSVLDVFTYWVSDPLGRRDSGTIAIRLFGENTGPDDIMLSGTTVDENAPGSRIATILVVEVYGGDTFTGVASDARFEVIDGALFLAPGVSLDHETEPSVTFGLRITDSVGLSLAKDFTLTVLDRNDTPTGTVTLGAQDGAAILTVADTLADEDGMGVVTYRWQRLDGEDWTDIPGATGPSFAPSAAETGLVRAVASYTDGGGTVEEVASAASARIGGDGRDTLATTPDTPLLAGLGGDDSLLGAAGDDSLLGQAGADTLDGGAGADALRGGDGSDAYRIADPLDTVIEAEDEGVDVVVASISYTLPAHVERLVLAGTARDGTGNAEANRIVGNAAANQVAGLDGNDLLFGQGDADTLDGGAGNDSLLGGEGADTLAGGAGNDRSEGNADGDTLEGGDGRDRLFGGAGADLLDGGAGEDQLFGGEDADSLSGGAENDRLDGGAGADWLDGGEGADRLFGGDGADTLDGGNGRDQLWGGADADIFRFGAIGQGSIDPADRIYDFEIGLDRIDLSALDADPTAEGDQAFVLLAAGAAFTGAAGEIRQIVDAPRNLVLIELSLGGDLLPDMAIVSKGTTPLAAGDFIL